MILPALGLLILSACSDGPEPGSPSPTAPAEDAPNVLIVVWDTVRADRLGCYGYELPTTPYLDALAEDSLLFERAVSPGMWTLPSHASLFTGLPVSAHGVSSKHKWLDHRFETLAEVFQSTGYGTYLFSANPHMSRDANLTQGFYRHP